MIVGLQQSTHYDEEVMHTLLERVSNMLTHVFLQELQTLVLQNAPL